MRVLFFMRNFSGYFRQFEPALRAMLERGNEVIVARDRSDDMRGEEWAHALQEEFPRLSLERTPHPRTDPWQDLKRQLRLTLDYVQFLNPNYAETSELVRRARRRAPDSVVRALERPDATLRRPGVLRHLTAVLRAAERATPSSPAMRELIGRTRPDVVLLTPHLMPGSHHPDYLRAAMDVGVPAILCVASWDNLSSKQIIRVRPDAVTVWNETQKREAVDIHELPADAIRVTGAQVYDQWFDWPARPRGAFLERVGLPADGRPYVLYVAGALFPAELTEAQWFARWLAAVRASPDQGLREAAVLVRPHPKRFEEWSAVDIDGMDHVALWPQEGRMPVEREAKQDFFDSIHHSAGVVGVNTSAMIEAGIAGKRVHTVLVPEFAGSQHGTLHFRYLTTVGGGLLHEARTLEEHTEQLARSVAEGGSDGGANAGFLEAFVRPQGLDRASTPLFLEAVDRAVAEGPRATDPAPVSIRALRVLLQPVRQGFRLRGHLHNKRNKRRRRRAKRRPLAARLGRLMSKTKQRSGLQRASLRLRNGSDRERALYVTVRKALAPRTTLVRSRAAKRDGHANGIAIERDRGWAILPPGTFPEADEIAALAKERLAAMELDELTRDERRKQFMLPIVDQGELDRESPLVRLALRDDVLAAVSAYLGTAPVLTNINLYVSKSTDRELMSSQLLHCDADDTAQVKIFVLCSEVTAANGPTEILDADASDKLRQGVGYQYRARVSDEEAEAVLGKPELQSVVGPPGTVCFVDTSRCFHYGSRVEADAAPRVAAMLQFLTPHSFMLPRNPAAKAPFKRLSRPGDGELVKLALGA